MRMMWPTSVSIGLAAILVCGQAPAADDSSSVAAARAVGMEGLKLAESGNYEAAVERLERADRLHHAPTTLGALGECHVKLGHLVLGTEMLQRLVREVLPSDAPVAFTTAQARAQLVLDETRPRIGQLRIVLEGAHGAAPTVTVDGEPVPAALLDLDRPTDPGAHMVEARAPGYLGAKSSVSLGEGERLRVTLVLAPEPTPLPGASAPPAAPIELPRTADRANQGSGSKTVGYVLLGVGAAGIVTGSVFGLLATGKKSDLDAACSNKACPTGYESDIRTLELRSTGSTLAFLIGGGALAAGAVVLFTSASRRHSVSAGVGSLRLQGRF